MADNESKFRFVVEAQKAIDDSAKLKAEFEKLAGNAKVADEALKKYNESVAKVGEFSGQGADRLKALEASFAAVTAGAGYFAQIIGGAAGVAGTLLRGAAAAETHQRALATLGSAYTAVERATRGTVTAEQALHAQQALAQAGLRVSADELATITRRAREYARANGTELPQALDQLVGALRSGSNDGLANFNIHLRAGENSTRGFHRVLRELGNQYRHDAPSARTLAEELSALNTNSTNLASSFATLVTNGLGLRDALRWINEQLVSIRDVAGMLGARDANNEAGERRLDRANSFQRANALAARHHGGRGLGVGGDQLTDAQLDSFQRRLEGSALMTDAEWRALQREAQQAAAANRGRTLFSFDSEISAGGTLAVGTGTAGPGQGHETAGHANGTDPTAEPARQLRIAMAEARRLGAPHAMGKARPGESVAQWLQRIASAQQAVNSSWESDVLAALATGDNMSRAARNDPNRANTFDAMLRSAGRDMPSGPSYGHVDGSARGRQIDDELGTTDPITGARRFGRRELNLGTQLQDLMGREGNANSGFAQQADRTRSAMQNLASTTIESFHGMAEAAGEFWGALVSGQDPVEAFRASINSLLKTTSQKALVRALEAGAEGVFRIASSYGTDPTGYTLLGNAAMWAGVAAVTGIGAVATNKPAAPQANPSMAGGGASAGPARASRSSGGGGGGGDTVNVINIDGHVFAGPAFQDFLQRNQRQSGRRLRDAA